VSPAIVSLVINNRVDGAIRISAETQRRVWDAVRSLGYVPNPVARSLATGRNRLLGVFTYEAVFPVQQHNFYYPFLVGIEEEAEAQDYNLILFTRASGPDGRRTVYKDGMNSVRIADGAIFLGSGERRDELATLQQEGFPFVYVGRREVPGTPINYVAAAYAQATAEIISYMVRLGHRRMAYIGNAERTESAQDREAGFRAAHAQLGIPLDERLIMRISPSACTPDTLHGLLERGVTGIAAENTGLMGAIMEAAVALDRVIPRDLSVAILGDPMTTADAIPSMTTFLIPRQEMGAQAVRLLIDTLLRPTGEPRNVTLRCVFVPGHTVAPPQGNDGDRQD
jgi:DNA-binding LacI/PurR family transcriptional regulator